MLNSNRMVVHIAFDMARRLKHDFSSAYGTHHVSTDDNFFGVDAARDAGFLSDHNMRAVEVALHFTIDLNFA